MTEGLYSPLWKLSLTLGQNTSMLQQKYIDTGSKERENLLMALYLFQHIFCSLIN